MWGEDEMKKKKKIIRIYFLRIEAFQKFFHMPIIVVHYCTENGMSICKTKNKGRRPEVLIFIARITPQKIGKRNHKRKQTKSKSN
jgi:hypothetical protein